MCFNSWARTEFCDFSGSAILLGHLTYLRADAFLYRQNKLGHRCWVLHRLSNRSHYRSRCKPQDILSDRELPTLPTCSVIRPICFDLQLSEVHRSLVPCHVFRCGNTAIFRATIVLVDNVFTSPALLHVFHVQRASPASSPRFAFSVHVLFSFILFPG